MVIAHQVIITAYGFWLPNDQRGSGSDFVRKPQLRRFGPPTRVVTRQSVANRSFDRALRIEAKQSQANPPVRFDEMQIKAIGEGFADCVATSKLSVYACAIVHDHTHLVIACHRFPIEQVINLLKGAATLTLTRSGLHPMRNHCDGVNGLPSPWSVGLWKVFLNTPNDVLRTIQYANGNIPRANLPAQTWPFVKPFPLLVRRPV